MPAIQRAVSADAGEILTLQRAAWVSEAQLHDTFLIPPLQQTLDEVRADIAGLVVLVALDGHRIVGTVRAHLHDAAWFVAKLGVVPDRKGEGLGTVLLVEIEALAPPEATHYALNTGPKSVDNIAFYERRGYVQEPGEDFLIHLAKPREHR